MIRAQRAHLSDMVGTLRFAHPTSLPKFFFDVYPVRGWAAQDDSSLQMRNDSKTKLPTGNSKTNEFLQLLHNKIASQQNYPTDALERNESGTVTMSFIIHPNGQIEKITIQKSSLVESIDQAAIKAVRMISPIREAKEYLKNPEFLTVNVEFRI